MSWRDFAGIVMPVYTDELLSVADAPVTALDGGAIYDPTAAEDEVKVTSGASVEAGDDDDFELDGFSYIGPRKPDPSPLPAASTETEAVSSSAPDAAAPPTKRSRPAWATGRSGAAAVGDGVKEEKSVQLPTPPVPGSVPQSSGPAATAAASTGDAPKRRSRWGAHVASSAAPAAPTSAPAPAPTPASASVPAPASAPGTDASPADLAAAAQSRAAALAASLSSTSALTPVQALAAADTSRMTPAEKRLNQLRLRIEVLNAKIANPAMYLALIPSRERSPSPPPVYDATGKRLNTRDVRFRDKLTTQRNALVELVQKEDASFTVAGYQKVRPSIRVPIPVKEHPEVNFSGLIIGPRGNTHRRMEEETGCRISVRGKLFANDARARRRVTQGEDEPAHVYIEGDTMEQVKRAEQMIRFVIRIIPEEQNEHKARQLRELADLQGFTKDDSTRAKMAAQRAQTDWRGPTVTCGHCGASSHVTQDCPVKGSAPQNQYQQQGQGGFFGSTPAAAPPAAAAAGGAGGSMEDELASFMATLAAESGAASSEPVAFAAATDAPAPTDTTDAGSSTNDSAGAWPSAPPPAYYGGGSSAPPPPPGHWQPPYQQQGQGGMPPPPPPGQWRPPPHQQQHHQRGGYNQGYGHGYGHGHGHGHAGGYNQYGGQGYGAGPGMPPPPPPAPGMGGYHQYQHQAGGAYPPPPPQQQQPLPPLPPHLQGGSDYNN